jgi:hypothetical protein
MHRTKAYYQEEPGSTQSGLTFYFPTCWIIQALHRQDRCNSGEDPVPTMPCSVIFCTNLYPMKRILLPLSTLVLFFFSGCQTDDLDNFESQEQPAQVLEDEAYAAGGHGNAYGKLRSCPTHKLNQQKRLKSPGLARKQAQIEAHIRTYIAKKKNKSKIKKWKSFDNTPEPTPTYTIPVYVHVLYSNQQENISDAQIQSQIDVLNADFNAINKEMSANMLPKEFAPLAAKTGIRFSWKTTDIVRKQSSRTEWGAMDDMKFTAKGGSDARFPGKYLNIWVCNLGGGNLGYAQYPGGDPATDGVVISPQNFGTLGYVQAPFDQGRTTTHEVGHWLNLYHIWGDGDCSVDDLVADTPLSDRPNYGCPSLVKHCNSTDMTMNFMDYTDDACMYMFTNGQRDRMHALFAQDGARSSFVQ